MDPSESRTFLFTRPYHHSHPTPLHFAAILPASICGPKWLCQTLGDHFDRGVMYTWIHVFRNHCGKLWTTTLTMSFEAQSYAGIKTSYKFPCDVDLYTFYNAVEYFISVRIVASCGRRKKQTFNYHHILHFNVFLAQRMREREEKKLSGTEKIL